MSTKHDVLELLKRSDPLTPTEVATRLGLPYQRTKKAMQRMASTGVLVVNGHQVHEPYVDYQLMVGVYYGPFRVPAGDVFVLGDNRPDSVDSRTFGPIPVSRITGRVLMRIWPPR